MRKRVGDHAVGKSVYGSRNSRGEIPVGIAVRKGLQILNTFFPKEKNRKWTWKGPNRETKNEIDFILIDTAVMVQDVEVIASVKTSEHKMVRSRIYLDLKTQRRKPLKRRTPNLHSIRNKVEKFRLLFENKFAVLSREDVNIDVTTDYYTNAVIQSTLAIDSPKANSSYHTKQEPYCKALETERTE